MKRLKILGSIVILLSLLSCKSPTDNVKLVIGTDIIKYTAMLNVRDAHSGEPAPADATITILGSAAPNIYEMSGKKNILLAAGMVTIGLRPEIVPAADQPISVTVEITAPGYNKTTKEVTFTSTQKQQVIDINITKLGSGTPPVLPTPEPIYNEVSINFTGTCPDRPEFQVKPSVYLYFRKLNSGTPFQYLGYMDKGNIRTKLLALNESYEFQIVYGGNVYKVSQKIEQPSYDLVIEMPGACDL